MNLLRILEESGTGLSVLLLAYASVTPLEAQSPATNALIDRVIAAYGETGRVASVRAHRWEATMQTHVGGEEGGVVRIVEGPDRLKVLIHYPSRVEIRVLDREQAWRGTSIQSLAPVQGPMRSSMVVQAARANLPWTLHEMRSKVGMARAPGGRQVLEIALGPGLALRASLEPDSHRIVQAKSVVEMGPMTILFRTEYSDFREVDGVLFPFHEENYASGIHAASTEVSRILLNPAGDALELPAFPAGEPTGPVAGASLPGSRRIGIDEADQGVSGSGGKFIIGREDHDLPGLIDQKKGQYLLTMGYAKILEIKLLGQLGSFQNATLLKSPAEVLKGRVFGE